MSSKVIELRMSDVTVEPFDLVHQVTALVGSPWESPYGKPKTVLEQSKNYHRYKNYFNNMMFLKNPVTVEAYNRLLERAERDQLLVFECTCSTICHMDVIRERLTEDLTAKGFEVTTNRIPYKGPEEREEE